MLLSAVSARARTAINPTLARHNLLWIQKRGIATFLFRVNWSPEMHMFRAPGSPLLLNLYDMSSIASDVDFTTFNLYTPQQMRTNFIVILL